MGKKLFEKEQTPRKSMEEIQAAIYMDEKPGMKVESASGTAVATLDDLGFNPEENMEGTEPRLPQIGIVHQAQLFKMPDDSKASELACVIIDSNRTNAFWAKSINEGGAGQLPDCFSFDGLQPNGETPLSEYCAQCPKNKYGSETGQNGEGGRGKACKNSRRVHILLDGETIPNRLTLPPSSLKSWDEYMVSLTKKSRMYPTVVSRITLEKAQNKEGIEYSRPRFEATTLIDDRDRLLEIKDLREKFRKAMRSQEIVAEEAQNASDEKEPF